MTVNLSSSDNICMVLSEEIIPVSDIDMTHLETFIEQTRRTMAQSRTAEERKALEDNLILANTKMEIVKRLLKK